MACGVGGWHTLPRGLGYIPTEGKKLSFLLCNTTILVSQDNGKPGSSTPA